MNVNGVLGSMCFPSFPASAASSSPRTPTSDARSRVCSRRYNDWHIDEWCGTYPGRFIPLALAADLGRRRDGGRGPPRRRRRAATRSRSRRTPSKLEAAELPRRPLGPVLAGVRGRGHDRVPAHRLVVVELVITAHDAPIDVLITLQPINIVQCAADLLWSPVLAQVPGPARSRSSEGGIGWIPYFLEPRRLRSTTRHHAWTGQDFGDKLPSEVFRERIVHVLHRRPDRARAIATDRRRHDHAGSATTRTPTRRGRTSPEALMKSLERRARRRDRQDHARERDAALPLRPVRAPAEEQCTVGALRAEAPDVDVGDPQPAAEEVEHRHLVVREHCVEGPAERLTGTRIVSCAVIDDAQTLWELLDRRRAGIA